MIEQPKNFGFGEDETMLRDSARKFFAANCSADKVHALVASDPNIHRSIECIWDKPLWQQITQLGWMAAVVPEAAGGMGMPLVAAVALAEEAGRAAFPSPLIATLNTTLVLNQCGTEAANTALAAIAAGKPMSLAITGQAGSWEPGATDVELRDGKLHGVAWYVQDAGKADGFVVSARNQKGVGLYYVEADAADVVVLPDGIIDLTRDQARVEFKGAAAIELAPVGSGDEALARALPGMLAIVSADMVGAGEWLLQTTVEYANTRVQFDRPLGFFQAVKHPLVNVMIDIDRAKSLAYNAACAIDSDPELTDPDTIINAAHMAKACASDMAVFASSRAVQFHGGIGFTWECYVHLFFKRQMHNQMLYGDAAYHRAKLADRLIGEVA